MQRPENSSAEIHQLTHNKHRNTWHCIFSIPASRSDAVLQKKWLVLTIAVYVSIRLLVISSDDRFLPVRKSPLWGQVARHVWRHNGLIWRWVGERYEFLGKQKGFFCLYYISNPIFKRDWGPDLCLLGIFCKSSELEFSCLESPNAPQKPHSRFFQSLKLWDLMLINWCSGCLALPGRSGTVSSQPIRAYHLKSSTPHLIHVLCLPEPWRTGFWRAGILTAAGKVQVT